jgi:hypothetical protein
MPVQGNSLFHPRIFVQILGKKTFLKIMNGVFAHYFLFKFRIALVVDSEGVFLALVLKFLSELGLIEFVIVSALGV